MNSRLEYLRNCTQAERENEETQNEYEALEKEFIDEQCLHQLLAWLDDNINLNSPIFFGELPDGTRVDSQMAFDALSKLIT